MKPTYLVLGFFAAIFTSTFAQSPADKELLERLENGADKIKALEAVLQKSDEFSPWILRAGTLVAGNEKRFEDGAFLLYVGLWRADFDMECFPPEGLSGVGPFIVNSVFAQLLIAPLTRAVMKDPVAFARMIDRLKKWNPKVPKGYDPGYNFETRKSERGALEASKASRAEVIRMLSESSILLNDPEYSAAFRVNQAFKFENEDRRPTKVENETATKMMKRIEKEKGVKISLVE